MKEANQDRAMYCIIPSVWTTKEGKSLELEGALMVAYVSLGEECVTKML